MAVTFTPPANWFQSATDPTVTLTWAAGDEVVIFGATESGATTLGTPTATGLTFSLVTSSTGAGECQAYLWRATAGSGGASVVVTSARAGGGQAGIAGWVNAGAVASVTALAGTFTEAAYSSVAVAAGDTVIVALADFTAANPPGLTPSTGSGTATERVDTGNGTTYAVWAADWVATSAGTFTFGATSYGALQISQVGAVLATGGPTIPVLEQTRYRFGADDGNEAAHTFTAAENTGVTLAAAVPQLLRIQVDETAGVATSPRLAIQYKRTDEAATEWRNLTI